MWKDAGTIGHYYLYRQGDSWMAEDVDTGNAFEITYKQAMGEEPISERDLRGV